MARFSFGRCELDSSRHRLLVSGIERQIEPLVFDLLHYLVRRGDALVTQQELIDNVWKGRVVTDSAISVCINAARRVVGDNGSRQAVIRTVPRKGFKVAVEVTRQLGPGTAGEAAMTDTNRRPVIGVFPFDNLGEDIPAYLARGIVDDIATGLSRFHNIETLSTYSTMRLYQANQDPLDVARELEVSHAVTGTIRGNSDTRRITVTLVDVASGTSLWSERYEVHADDIFAAQDDAVYNIVSALIQGLTAHQTAVARRRPTNSLNAYECLLRGLQIYKWGVTSMQEARQALFWFDRAIELDPDYAHAQAWRECCRACLWSTPPRKGEIDAAAEGMRAAIMIDETDHEVHRLKGALHMVSGEYEPGEYHLAKSVELNPNDANILIKIGMYRSFLAENTDDLTYVDLAFRRNPHHPAWYWHDRAITLFAHEAYEEAIAALQRSDILSESAFLYLAASSAAIGELAEASQYVDRLRAQNPQANIDWLEAAYPTRCYQESERKHRFYDLLTKAGL